MQGVRTTYPTAPFRRPRPGGVERPFAPDLPGCGRIEPGGTVRGGGGNPMADADTSVDTGKDGLARAEGAVFVTRPWPVGVAYAKFGY